MWKIFSRKGKNPGLKSTQQQGFYRYSRHNTTGNAHLAQHTHGCVNFFIEFTCHIIVTTLAEFFRVPTEVLYKI